LVAACDGTPQEVSGSKTRSPDPPTNLLRLTPETEAKAALHVMPVTTRDFRVFREFPATIQANANRLAEITTLVRGRANDVLVDFGQDVEAETLLATLHSSELGLSQSSYLKAHAQLTVTERAFQRAKVLLEEKVIGQAEYQRREGELLTARSELREAHDRLRLLGMPEDDIARLRRDEKIRSTVFIRAPFAGRIIARNIVRGEIVEMTDQLFTIADLSDVWVIAHIPEKDIAFVQDDQKVEVEVTAYPGESFEGRIGYIGDVLDPTTRTIRLRVVVANPQKRLKPEMFAKVRMWAKSEAGILTIPPTAIVHDRGENIVFVQIEDHAFERRPVTLGEEQDGQVKVTDGLHAGDLVVAEGAFRLKSELAARQHPMALQ
jgi:cobalt-zinc-cadmium efflux system membrane fusion protein